MGIIRNKKILIVILVIAALLRLWGLSVNPPHITPDEAALGYNAYSILKTARDEHGQFLPIIFQSFGDWKPGLYVYLDVPFIAVFGLNEFATRLPGAISGIASVWFIYLLVGELFWGKPWARQAQLFSAFFLGVSPWHVHFSRGAWEAGVSLSLTILAIYFFLRAIREKPNLLVASAVFFGLTFLTYQGAKLSTGVILFSLALVFTRDIIKLPKSVITKSILIGFVLILPVIFSFFDGKVGRLAIFNVFSYHRSQRDIEEILRLGDLTRESWQYVIYHSEPINLVKGVVERWMNHFSPRFLFFQGDWTTKRYNVPDGGMLLFIDALFLFLGLVFLARLKQNKSTIFLWIWLFLSVLPAALSRDSVHAIRGLNMVVPLTILLGIGGCLLFNYIRGKKIEKFLTMVLIVCYLGNYLYYLDQYWVHMPVRGSQFWQYGYKQMVQKVSNVQGQYDEVVVEQSYDQPYIYFLFYEKYPPRKWQEQVKDSYVPSPFGDVGLFTKLDNITFRVINWSGDRLLSNKLFVVFDNLVTIPRSDLIDTKRFKYIDKVNFLNNATGFLLLGVR